MDTVVSDYDLENSLRFGLCETPEELALQYGFTCYGDVRDKFRIVHTAPRVISLKGELFLGKFYFTGNCFETLVLQPVTDVGDDWQSERLTSAEREICGKIVSSLGNRVGQMWIRTQILRIRDVSSYAHCYRVFITEHPFFKELYALFEDFDMSAEDVTNAVTQIEAALDKYKDLL